jgi:hypothetical protein
VARNNPVTPATLRQSGRYFYNQVSSDSGFGDFVGSFGDLPHSRQQVRGMALIN